MSCTDPHHNPCQTPILLVIILGIFTDTMRPIDTTFIWDLTNNRALMPKIEGGQPMTDNKKSEDSMPRDKHWAAIVNRERLFFTYNLDPLRVMECELNGGPIPKCRFVHKEGMIIVYYCLVYPSQFIIKPRDRVLQYAVSGFYYEPRCQIAEFVVRSIRLSQKFIMLLYTIISCTNGNGKITAENGHHLSMRQRWRADGTCSLSSRGERAVTDDTADLNCHFTEFNLDL